MKKNFNFNFNFIFIFLTVIILASVGIWYANKSPLSSMSFITEVTYVCDGGKTIDAAFYKGESRPTEPGEPPIPSGMVKIVLSDGRNFDLPQTISASGARYASDDELFIFWSKGDGAIVLENNVEKNYMGCVIPPEKTIKVISPNGGETWSKDQEVKILWSASEAIESVNIRLAIFGSEEAQNFNAALVSNVPNTGEYEWTVQELHEEVWGVRTLPESDKYLITVEDSQHNDIYDKSDVTFSINNAVSETE